MMNKKELFTVLHIKEVRISLIGIIIMLQSLYFLSKKAEQKKK